MKFSKFGQKFTQPTGISQLMDDLGDALKSDQPINMLGGGNPAKIDAVNELFIKRLALTTIPVRRIVARLLVWQITPIHKGMLPLSMP